MHAKPLLSAVLFATLSGSFLAAQQPGSAGPPQPGGGMEHSRGAWGGGEGMRGGLRIGPPGIWWHNADLIQKLTLTPDQQKKMDDILQQSKLQLIDLRANVEKQEVLMEPMLAANPPDTNKILAQIDHTAQARAELEKANAKMLLGIRNVLTPDQWAKLQAERREHRGMRMRGGPEGLDGRGGQGGPPAPSGGGEGMD
ncbi:Spy/CpxP family protein refolding chaperone [Granulicella sp. S190]|uniref:Spy/CpxP family protein refolding chaperone n=1 Tax=Granulicella sp. S190 TaxID=1747226 RepID=UPI00131BE81A|nr:Spy/CpxP family protein refolding chaperone [Granulicella sp. S190]